MGNKPPHPRPRPHPVTQQRLRMNPNFCSLDCDIHERVSPFLLYFLLQFSYTSLEKYQNLFSLVIILATVRAVKILIKNIEET